jgi:hypothetical protein
LILSIELHCGPIQQIKMVEYMKLVFGDRLARPIWSSENVSSVKRLPSPQDLKGKILLKGKTLKIYGVEETQDEDDNTLSSSSSSPQSPKDEKLTQQLSDVTYLSTIGFKKFGEEQVPWEMS